jgi:hypothetical protein
MCSTVAEAAEEEKKKTGSLICNHRRTQLQPQCLVWGKTDGEAKESQGRGERERKSSDAGVVEESACVPFAQVDVM